MLEKMGEFFDARLAGYEAHQLTCIESAREFYPYTAACLPDTPGIHILDLGCGTGLELEYYFQRNPSARITGIDLAPGMLQTLRGKFPEKKMELICGSYFDVSLGSQAFDGAVSVESLHHFTQEEKLPLYRRLYAALRPGSRFILTDYFAASEEEEQFHGRELVRLKQEQGLGENTFYHYDTPLTVAHELEVLEKARFSVEILAQWGATCTIRAIKNN